MKIRLLCVFAFLTFFAGCSKIKDATTIRVSTHLQTSIPVVITSVGMKSIDLIAIGTPISFTKNQDLTLASNVDLTPYIERIKSIDLNSLVVTITGLTAGQTINTVTLAVTGVGNIFTQTNITMDTNSFTPVIASGILDQVSTKLTADRKITITVSGTASSAMTFNVGLNIDTSVIVYTII